MAEEEENIRSAFSFWKVTVNQSPASFKKLDTPSSSNYKTSFQIPALRKLNHLRDPKEPKDNHNEAYPLQRDGDCIGDCSYNPIQSPSAIVY
jgi:hypothetical protein